MIECKFIDPEGVTFAVIKLKEPLPRIYLTPVFKKLTYIRCEEDPISGIEPTTIEWELTYLVDEYDGGPFAIYKRKSPLWK